LSLPLSTANCSEYSAVEDGHDDARDVEGSHRRVDEEVRVVERTQRRVFVPSRCVVNTGNDGRRHRRRYDPRDDDGYQYTSRVFVTSV